MNSAATRQIFWNLPNPANKWLLYALFALALVVFFAGLKGQLESVLIGKKGESGKLRFSFKRFLADAFFQSSVLRQRWPGMIHSLFYLGFWVLLFATTVVFVDYDLGWHIYHGAFYLALKFFADLFGLAVLIGSLLAILRRYWIKDDRLHNSRFDMALLVAIPLLVLQGFVLEGLRIHGTADPFSHYYPVGHAFSLLFSFLPLSLAGELHYGAWWFHALTFFCVFALLPYSKFLHLLTSTANVSLKKENGRPATYTYAGDIEKLMETDENFSFGLGTIKDYRQGELLDLQACTSCGRCQDACPAYAAKKTFIS